VAGLREPIVTLAAETNRRLRLTDDEAHALGVILRRAVPLSPTEAELLVEIQQRLDRLGR